VIRGLDCDENPILTLPMKKRIIILNCSLTERHVVNGSIKDKHVMRGANHWLIHGLSTIALKVPKDVGMVDQGAVCFEMSLTRG